MWQPRRGGTREGPEVPWKNMSVQEVFFTFGEKNMSVQEVFFFRGLRVCVRSGVSGACVAACIWAQGEAAVVVGRLQWRPFASPHHAIVVEGSLSQQAMVP